MLSIMGVIVIKLLWEGNICELLVFLDALLTAELHAFFQKQKTFCLVLGGSQTIATFPVHNFKSWVSSMIVRFTNHKRVVVGETKLFKAFN